MLVAAFWRGDPHHSASRLLLGSIAQGKHSAFTSGWSLLEIARGLIRYGLEERIVLDCINEILKLTQVIPVNEHLFHSIDHILKQRLPSADALHLKTCLNTRVQKLITLDEEHFHRAEIKQLTEVVFPEDVIAETGFSK